MCGSVSLVYDVALLYFRLLSHVYVLLCTIYSSGYCVVCMFTYSHSCISYIRNLRLIIPFNIFGSGLKKELIMH